MQRSELLKDILNYLEEKITILNKRFIPRVYIPHLHTEEQLEVTIENETFLICIYKYK